MGLFGAVFKIIAVVLLAAIGLAAYLYFTDYAVEATVVDKGEDANGEFVVIRPELVPYDYKHSIDGRSASFVCRGYEVAYHIQSQHYLVYDRSGKLVYDSQEGLNDAVSPLRCAALGV